MRRRHGKEEALTVSKVPTLLLILFKYRRETATQGLRQLGSGSRCALKSMTSPLWPQLSLLEKGYQKVTFPVPTFFSVVPQSLSEKQLGGVQPEHEPTPDTRPLGDPLNDASRCTRQDPWDRSTHITRASSPTADTTGQGWGLSSTSPCVTWGKRLNLNFHS